MSAATTNPSVTAKSSTMASSKQPPKNGNGGKVLDGARKQAASPVDGPNSRKQQTSQPRAWQGVNPITQRSSTTTPNGIEKPLPRLPATSDAKSNGDINTQTTASDRLCFLYANIIGTDVVLTLKNGEEFTGVFSGASLDPPSKPQYVLKMTKRTKHASHQQTNGTVELPDEYTGEGEHYSMTFDMQDTVHLDAPNVSTSSVKSDSRSGTPSFRTDTEISGKDAQFLHERELQRWDGGTDSTIDMSLGSSGTAGWDQFATNERMYGVQSTWDENIYTTQINRNDPKFLQNEARAAKIAREIELSTASNAHVAEERIQNAEAGEDGVDEEDKYSGVKRDTTILPKRTAGAYVPPSQRPLTTAPTVPGAPFDPAIISLAKPTSSATPTITSEQLADFTKLPPIRVEAPKTDARDAMDTTLDPTGFTPVQAPATVPAPTHAPAPTPQKKASENTTEDHVRGTVDAFKQFANLEKLRMKQAQEAKRTNARFEKNSKLNDLKKFAANFKLNSRVPDDLVPILAKDREKQLEIQRKADEAAKAQEQDKASSTVSPPPANSTQSQTGALSSPDPRQALNQHHRTLRASQPPRAPMPAPPGQLRGAQSQRPQQGNQQPGRSMPPLPADLRMPAAPTKPSTERTLSPSSGPKLNVNAFEFRPSAINFTPSGTTPSPQRPAAAAAPAARAVQTSSSFFKGDKKRTRTEAFNKKGFNSFDRFNIDEEEQIIKPGEEKKSNGGIPKPYRAAPTWPTDSTATFKDAFPKSQLPNQGVSPLHTPNSNGPMPHAHQLPVHMQGAPPGNPSQRPPYFAPQQHGHNQHFDPRMQPFGHNGSVQNSPRFPPAQMAFNNQMPQQMQMQMPQFGGQQVPGYGMSPQMQFRQMQMPPGQMMMMPGQQQGQMPQMRQGGYAPGPQFGGPPMGGHMMVQNPSSGYMNGPVPQPQYSPMPPHAQPHMPHMQHGGPGAYNNSPRAPMMQHQGSHQGSHQGFQPPMHMQQQQFGPGQGQGQPHPYHLQHNQRQHSGGGQFSQMTPRQQNAAPQHPSPGMGGAAGQGDEGK